MIKIRKAELSDITALGNMRLKFQSHMENSNPDIWRVTDEGKEQVESQVAAFLDTPDAVTFIVENDQGVIGYAYGLVRRRDTHLPQIIGHIGNIYVDK